MKGGDIGMYNLEYGLNCLGGTHQTTNRRSYEVYVSCVLVALDRHMEGGAMNVKMFRNKLKQEMVNHLLVSFFKKLF